MKLFVQHLTKLAAVATALSLLAGCDTSAPTNPTASGLPAPLSQAEPISNLASAGCHNGGLVLYHGLDYNNDGRLGIYERHRQETICNPDPLHLTPTTGVALGKPRSTNPEGG